MNRQRFLVLLLAALGCFLATRNDLLAREAPTRTPDLAPAAVHVTLDVSETPDLAEWAAKAQTLVEKWHPIISGLLKSDGFTPPSGVKIIFSQDMKGVAYTSGNTIHIAARWVRKHPDDYGMVIHELTHVVQAYHDTGRDAGWLVEGIADYIRFFKYEPETKLGPVNPVKAGYREGYRTAARFLAWVEQTHDKGIVATLNQALRKSEYKEELFKDATGENLDDLWAEFLESVKK